MKPEPKKQAAEPLRVLYMGTQFRVGGITRHILSLRDWLRAHGHSVALAGTADVWGGPESEPEFLDLPTRYVSVDGGSTIARLSQAAVAARRLRRWLAKDPVDLIHCHESAPALVAQLACIGRSVPLAVTYHGSEPERIAAFGEYITDVQEGRFPERSHLVEMDQGLLEKVAKSLDEPVT